MWLSRALAIILLVINSAAYAGSISVDMTSTAAQFEAGFGSEGGAEFQSGFFYNDQGSVLLNSGLVAKGGGDQDAASGLVVGGGVKALAGNIQQAGVTNSAFCIALGAQGAFTPPAMPLVTLVGEFFSSVKITTFGDSDHFSQFALRLETGPPQAKFFIGYREITFSIIGVGDVAVDKGSYIGISFKF